MAERAIKAETVLALKIMMDRVVFRIRLEGYCETKLIWDLPLNEIFVPIGIVMKRPNL